MRGISCLLNFKENFRNNTPYYELLARQICSANYEFKSQNCCTFEHATLSAEQEESIVTKVCEGYQFTVAFSGQLFCYEKQKAELSAFGYHFLSDHPAELALFSYIHYAEKCVEKLSGNFSLIVYDSMRRCVFTLSKGKTLPVFYASVGDFYILSSSQKGIISFPDMPKRIKKDAVLELISAGNRIPDQIFENIYILPQNKALKISKNGILEIPVADSTPVSDNECNPLPHRIGLVSSCDAFDSVFLSQAFQENPTKSVSVYAEKFPDQFYGLPIKKQHLIFDAGTVLQALKTSVTACGFPFMSCFDFLLPIALKQAKGMNESVFFAEPDSFSSYYNYTNTLFANDIFHDAVKENLQSFCPKGHIFPEYTKIIADFLGQDVYIPALDETSKNYDACYESQKLKTVLRRLLLDIISKEHSPIFAFFKRSALLRLCEGGFSFTDNERETELISYLIKLNLWFEIFSPSII